MCHYELFAQCARKGREDIESISEEVIGRAFQHISFLCDIAKRNILDVHCPKQVDTFRMPARTVQLAAIHNTNKRSLPVAM